MNEQTLYDVMEDLESAKSKLGYDANDLTNRILYVAIEACEISVRAAWSEMYQKAQTESREAVAA